MCSQTGDTSAVGEGIEACTGDTACGVAEQSKAGENVESSRVVPTDHLCEVRVQWSAEHIWNPLKIQMGYGSIILGRTI